MSESGNVPVPPSPAGAAPPPCPEGRPTRCRRRGRRFAAGALGLALAATAGALALRAAGQSAPHGFAHGPFAAHSFCSGDPDRHVVRAVGWLVDDIKGTPEQEQKLAAIAKSAVADLCLLKSQARENHLQAVAILTKETVDRSALESVRVRQMELANGASTRLTKAIADVADILTPAQRVDLAERLKKHHG